MFKYLLLLFIFISCQQEEDSFIDVNTTGDFSLDGNVYNSSCVEDSYLDHGSYKKYTMDFNLKKLTIREYNSNNCSSALVTRVHDMDYEYSYGASDTIIMRVSHETIEFNSGSYSGSSECGISNIQVGIEYTTLSGCTYATRYNFQLEENNNGFNVDDLLNNQSFTME